MNVFDLTQGDSPILLAQPHGGTFLPDEISARLNPIGKALADTDWHINRLYQGLLASASVIRSNIHRYVIDANRDPQGGSLYPGQNTTSLCPITNFEGREIWRAGQAPNADEIGSRTASFHAPYHHALAAELTRIHARHGIAILFDCHSIRGEIPFLFGGVLPTFSIGTNDGKSCAAALENAVTTACPAQDRVLNGRFKGGWTTRHYGRPKIGFHAVQLELSQRAYMRENPPWTYLENRAQKLREKLAVILSKLEECAAHV